MGREIRRVPYGWEHPKNNKGRFIPMHDETWVEAMTAWIRDYGEEFATWSSEDIENPPQPDYYRPAFKDEPTAYQIYETVTEGTPVSPVFLDENEMREWLMSKEYSPVAIDRFIKGGWAPSMTFCGGVVRTGIESLAD